MNASRTNCFSIELARIRISNALTSAQHCFKLRSAGAARSVSPRAASISGQRGAAAGAPIDQRLGGVVEMQPLHHRLWVTVRALGNARGAVLLSDFIERQKALAGGARSSPTHGDPPAPGPIAHGQRAT